MKRSVFDGTGLLLCPAVNYQANAEKVFVNVNGETRYLWCAVDYEAEVLEFLSLNDIIGKPR